LDKTLYDDYLRLVAANKLQIKWGEVKETVGKFGLDNSKAGADSLKIERPLRFLTEG